MPAQQISKAAPRSRTRSVSASVKAGGKTLTVQASAPINTEPKQTRPSRRKPTVSDVNDDILAMGNEIIAVEAPWLRIYDVTIGFAPRVAQFNSVAFNILQNVMDDKVGIVFETVTLVIQNTSLPLAEVSDPSKARMADVPVLWGATPDSSFEYADPDSVPADLVRAARIAAQRFVESLNGLVDIHSLAVHEKPVNRLVYSL